jgi:hypothetical protein
MASIREDARPNTFVRSPDGNNSGCEAARLGEWHSSVLMCFLLLIAKIGLLQVKREKHGGNKHGRGAEEKSRTVLASQVLQRSTSMFDNLGWWGACPLLYAARVLIGLACLPSQYLADKVSHGFEPYRQSYIEIAFPG